jgi:hypothetical protein
MRRRVFVCVALGTVLALSTIAAPAQAGKAAKSNTGRAVHSGKAVHAVRPGAITDFTQIKKPVASYVTNTCVIDLSAIPDFTSVTSVSGCGVTVTFSTPMEKRTVGASWTTWGSPPYTEGATPYILYSAGATSVTLTYSSKSRRIGFEAEPNPFEIHKFVADFRKGSGAAIGSISRKIDGNAGARLLAGVTGLAKKQWVKSIDLSSDVDFAIAQLRVS